MRKKLGTRFPASRIKKIMQSDEDVGKIALAVPILVSKALELFLQDLCDRAYEITLQRGAKTLNSSHLPSKSSNDWTNKVPNLGGMEPCEDEKGICRRRKMLPHGDKFESNEDLPLRSSKMAMRNANVSLRGCGRGRGRGRGRPPTRARDVRYVKCEDVDNNMFVEHDEVPSGPHEGAEKENTHQCSHPSATSAIGGAATSADEAKQEPYPPWPLPDGVGNIGIEPSRLVQLNMQIDEDEDYDNED